MRIAPAASRSSPMGLPRGCPIGFALPRLGKAPVRGQSDPAITPPGVGLLPDPVRLPDIAAGHESASRKGRPTSHCRTGLRQRLDRHGERGNGTADMGLAHAAPVRGVRDPLGRLASIPGGRPAPPGPRARPYVVPERGAATLGSDQTGAGAGPTSRRPGDRTRRATAPRRARLRIETRTRTAVAGGEPDGAKTGHRPERVPASLTGDLEPAIPFTLG